jgi:HPt (histidine-containing phosphotransfer) domain-containing protein
MQPTVANHEIEVPPIDFRRLKMITDTETEIASILEIFFKTTEEIVADMKDASLSGAFTQWKDAAHKLRGAAANIGMAPLEKLCLESEKIGWLDESDRTSMMQQIATEIAHIQAYIARKNPFLLISGK